MRRHAVLYGAASVDISNVLFLERREKIISDLRANRNDKSLAGRVDPLVSPLVTFINDRFRCYVTSSSCSGRISLFHKGEMTSAVAHRKRGSFGRGTLFQSHEPLLGSSAVESLVTALHAFAAWRAEQSEDPLVRATELLQLKFEPMIVHVLCATLNDAARLLQCAGESGQMASGLLACSRGTAEGRKMTCCITSPLVVDVPLFAQGEWLLGNAQFDGSAWRALLTNTLTHVNGLFEENQTRRERFMREMETRLF